MVSESADKTSIREYYSWFQLNPALTMQEVTAGVIAAVHEFFAMMNHSLTHLHGLKNMSGSIRKAA